MAVGNDIGYALASCGKIFVDRVCFIFLVGHTYLEWEIVSKKSPGHIQCN